jgi:membrane protein
VTVAGLKRAVGATYHDLVKHHTLQVAAALSYYFALAIFPGLIFLSALLGSIPFTDMFARTLDFMSRILPPDTMRFVQSTLLDVVTSNSTTWLSVSMLGMLWVASSAFDASIEALDIAYEVQDDRPFWKTRLIAIGLGFLCIGLWLAGLAVMILGPKFGEWLAARMSVSQLFVMLWPVIHWAGAVVLAVLAVEAIYFLAPNVKQRFLATLPGAILAVSFWIGLSYLLGIYFRHFANFNRTYGTLGGFIALMTWLYWNSFALLVGAELNAELAKESAKGKIPSKEHSSDNVHLGKAAA